MKKIIIGFLISLFTVAIASAQSDKKQILVNNPRGNAGSSDKNYKTADTATQVKISSDTSVAVKKNLPAVTNKPTQGSLRNQQPLVIDSTIIRKKIPANKANIAPVTDKKNIPVK